MTKDIVFRECEFPNNLGPTCQIMKLMTLAKFVAEKFYIASLPLVHCSLQLCKWPRNICCVDQKSLHTFSFEKKADRFLSECCLEFDI